MKKTFTQLIVLLVTLGASAATTVDVDSLRYTLNSDGTATVSACLYLSTPEITIPQTVNDGTQDYTVTKIGDSAFYGKSFVTSVTFPSTLTTFGRYSFSRTGLTSVVIPEGVTTLTFELFSYCDQLTSVTIPEGVTTMERGVFYDDDLLNGVVLPSTLTTIGFHAFGRCIGLTSITVPANVSIIDEYAFQYCSNLETVDLKPQTMTTIGRNAFDSCEKLTAFHVPEGITTLGQDVFYGCKAMQELSLPSTLTSIGYRTFYNCISLPSVTIPEGVTTIGNEAFRNCKLLGGDITLPAALTSLGSYAFAGCENVERVTFLGNNDVTMPGESQFSSMKKLKSVKLPDNLSTITRSMFYGCNQLESIDLSRLPATVISPYAFHQCKALASVQLPPATATIGDNAFVYCENLTAISFPSTLKSIGRNAFDNNNLTSLQLNDGLETIGNYAFSGSKDLSASPVVIPQSVTSIGDNAFYNCDQMTSFTFPESLTTLGTYVLASCDNLQTVVFPRNMTVIPRSTCEGCKKLANVTLPENVETIGQQAFLGATSLPAITLPATVKTIEDTAFRDTNIPSLTLNEGLESIGASAFYNCDRLKTLNIPSTVKNIGNYAFYNCDRLKTLNIPSTVKNIGNYAFYNCDSILTVTFPEDMTALTTIGTNLFGNNIRLTKVTLPKTGMSSIPNNMFQECDRLRNIQLPATITSIGEGAFYGCDSLQTIYIPDGVKTIGYRAFSNCRGLRYIRLPEGLEAIGAECFGYTEKLQFINIPSTVTSIGSYAIHTTANSSNTNFKSVGIMGSTMPTTSGFMFWQYQPAFSLLVPAGQEEEYQTSTAWTPNATDNRTIKGYPAEKQTLTQDLIHLSCLDKESYKSGSPEAVWIDWFEGMGNYRIWYTDANGNKTTTMPIEGGDYTLSVDFEEGPYYKPATFNNIATFSLKEIADEDFALLWDFYSKTYDRTKQKSTWTGSGGGGAPANWGLIEGVKESAVGIFGVKWNNGHVEEINFGTGVSVYNLNANETPVSIFALPQVKKIEFANVEFYGNISDKVEAWLASGKTLSPTLEYLDLQRNKLEGNLSTLAGALPALKTLDVHQNRFSTIWPALPETLETIDISSQTIEDVTATIDLRDMTNEGFFSTLPSIIFYDPATRTYAEDIKVSVRSKSNGASFTLNYVGDNDFTVTGSPTWKDESGTMVKCSYTDSKNKTTNFNANFYYDMGDVDFNGLVNVVDLQQSINYLMRDYADNYRYNFYAGDLNTDNAINVLDVVRQVDLLLSMNQPTTTYANRRASSAEEQKGCEAKLYQKNGHIILDATRPVAAIDMTVNSTDADRISWLANTGMATAKKTLADGRVHIIIYSAAGKTLPTGETMLAANATGSDIEKATLVDCKAQVINTILNNSDAGLVTGIENLSPVLSESKEAWYTIDGRKLNTKPIEKGIYIVNGKKVIIK